MAKISTPTRAVLIIAVVAAFLLLLYWLNGDHQQPLPNSLLHPTPPNLQIADATPLSIPVGGVDIVDVIPDTSSYVRIGVNEGPTYAMFGHVGEVAVDEFNRVYILDTESNAVYIYNVDGTYLSSFGSAGRGPGEFLRPTSITLVDRGSKAVITDLRITVFAHTDTSGFVFDRTFNVDYPAFWEGGACSMNGYVYMLDYAPDVNGVIHKFSLDGTYIDSFGSTYIADVPFVVSQLSDRGHLACSAPYNIVGWVRRYMPFISGYSDDGTLLWVFRLEDFTSAGVLQGRTDDGRPSLRYPSLRDGQSRHMGLHVDDHGNFLSSFITVSKMAEASPYDLVSTGHVFRIDPGTVEGTYWGPLGGFAAAWEDNIALRTDRPYPHVRIYKTTLN